MLERLYPDQVCSVARALEVVGERWTLLVLRDAFLGVRRFDDFQRSLGVARNILSARLRRLCEYGILERRPYMERPRRVEYRLTDRGRDLFPVIVALMQWGDRHLTDPTSGPPRLLNHRDCGAPVHVAPVCDTCSREVSPSHVTIHPGPGVSGGGGGG
jgi:DNA-binding HxlR family transcriptional regulator